MNRFTRSLDSAHRTSFARFRGGFLLLGAVLLGALSACGDGGTSGTGGTGGTTTTTSTAGGGAGGTGGSGGSTGGGGGAGGATGGFGGSLSFTCSGNTVAFANDVLPIVNCSAAESCHQIGLGNPNGAYDWLVNQPSPDCPDGRLRVKPGDPENSYLIDKLTNSDLCSGSPMPKVKNGPWEPLPSDQIQIVYDWICQGAKND